MIKLGNNNIGKIYLGSNSIGKAYLGSNLVFQKGSSPTPSIQPVFYDHIIFDGTAYIETDIVPPADASFNVRLGNETQKVAQRLFWCIGTDCFFGAVLSSGTSSTRRYYSVYYGSDSSASANEGYNNFSSATINFFLTPYKFGWGSTASYSITPGSGIPTGGIILGSNSTHSGQPYTGEMWTFYIYGSDASASTKAADFESYTPLYTLRPCTYDGEAGYWCVETSTFYGNTAGAGQLTVANDE